MIGDKFRPTFEVPVKTVPWDKSGNYLKRVIRWLFYTRRWKFSEDWYFKLFDGTWVKAYGDFIFDGASVPKLFRFLLSPTGILFIPGVFHDCGYKHDKLFGVIVKELDDGYLEIVREFDYYPNAGKAWWDYVFKKIGYQITKFYVIPNIVYSALIVGGWSAWSKHRKKEKNNHEKNIHRIS